MSQGFTRRALIASAMVVAMAGSARAQMMYVPVEPPALRHEERPPRPGERFVWQPGYWRWDGRGHVWVPGVWIERPRGRARWVEGHWRREPRGWVWVPGHWV